MGSRPLSPEAQARHTGRPKLTLGESLRDKVVLYQTRECIPTFSGAVLSLVRKGLKVEGLL